MTMTLKEMEDAARRWQEEEAAAAKLTATTKAKAEAEKLEELHRRVAIFLSVKTGLTLVSELKAVLDIPSYDNYQVAVRIRVPEHAAIQTRLTLTQDKMLSWGTAKRRWEITGYPYGQNKYCKDLGDALAIAACLWAKAEKAEEKETEREAQREAGRKEKKLDHIERGLHYVGVFEDHPFLKPIFDLLAAYVKDKEVFEADLDAAEEFAASMDESYMRKLNESRMAQAKADNARHRLQQDLWAEQESHRTLEREQRKG